MVQLEVQKLKLGSVVNSNWCFARDIKTRLKPRQSDTDPASAGKMLLRLVRASHSAARHFSTEAKAVTTASAVKKSNGGGGRDTLGRRLMSLVYRKRSAVIAINKWKEEGRTIRKYELNRIVRELRKLKRHKHALEVCLTSFSSSYLYNYVQNSFV